MSDNKNRDGLDWLNTMAETYTDQPQPSDASQGVGRFVLGVLIAAAVLLACVFAFLAFNLR